MILTYSLVVKRLFVQIERCGMSRAFSPYCGGGAGPGAGAPGWYEAAPLALRREAGRRAGKRLGRGGLKILRDLWRGKSANLPMKSGFLKTYVKFLKKSIAHDRNFDRFTAPLRPKSRAESACVRADNRSLTETGMMVRTTTKSC